MVEYSPPNLDRVFGALADPTRRSIVARLATGEASIGEIARAYPITLQAVIKHLDVLEDAALVTRTKRGRTVGCALAAERLELASAWIAEQTRVWNERLDRLETYLHELQTGDPDER
jgi:DNA-binding transcriptional ArsR family regulator